MEIIPQKWKILSLIIAYLEDVKLAIPHSVLLGRLGYKINRPRDDKYATVKMLIKELEKSGYLKGVKLSSVPLSDLEKIQNHFKIDMSELHGLEHIYYVRDINYIKNIYRETLEKEFSEIITNLQ